MFKNSNTYNNNTSLSEKAIAEAAYYIWQNNGCPANTSLQDWNAAINQLTLAYAKKTSCKTSSCKTSSATKKSAAKKSLKKSK